MKHPLPWLAALFAAVLMATPAAADHHRGYYEDDEEDVQFGLHIGPDSFGLYFDQEDYDEYGRSGPRFGLRLDDRGAGIFFEDGDRGYRDRRYQRGHWYCPRRYCEGGDGHWGRGYGRGRGRGHHRGRGRHASYGCHPIFKRGYRRGRDVLIRARMCYDRDGNAYIEPGSRRVVRTYR